MKVPHSRAVRATPTVANITPGARMGLISENLVSIPPEKRMIHNANIPMNCVNSNDSKLMNSKPKNIPTPKNNSNAGAPKRYATLPATTATNSNNAQTNNTFSI